MSEGVGRCFVYALIDPRTRMPFYVGQTRKGCCRIGEHIRKKKCQVGKAIHAMQGLGWKPEWTVLEAIEDPDAPGTRCWWRMNATSLNGAEIWWIAYGKACGWPLFNSTDGGSSYYAITSPDVIERHRARATAMWKQPGYREAHVVSEEMRAKARVRMVNRWEDPVYRERISEILRASCERFLARDRADPERVTRRVARRKETINSSPEFGEKMSTLFTARRSDPEFVRALEAHWKKLNDAQAQRVGFRPVCPSCASATKQKLHSRTKTGIARFICAGCKIYYLATADANSIAA